MALQRVPCVLMRGGTSKGPFFLRDDLPRDPAARDALLINALGAGHELQIDGIGGGNPLSSKVAIIGAASRPDADVDYLFAQVKVSERLVDTSPNCGNMLSGVGPFAIEAGLVRARAGVTDVRIHNVNTGKIIIARVNTPDGQVTYEGDARIDGVPGSAAPVLLTFADAAGAKTGRLLPTGAARETIDGVTVSCIDAAMPLVLIPAEALGVSGHETPAELDARPALLARIETIRREAGVRMGLGDVSKLVIPKPVLVAPARSGGTLAVRYFMPATCHKALAITGAVGIATACATPGTVAAALSGPVPYPARIAIEHPSGQLEVRLEQPEGASTPTAMVLRTARRLFEGSVLAAEPMPMLPLAA